MSIGHHLQPKKAGDIAADIAVVEAEPGIFDCETTVAAPGKDVSRVWRVLHSRGFDVCRVVRVHDEVEGLGDGVEIEEISDFEHTREFENELRMA